MAENSLIGWTDHTFNPWIGCQKVGPGCDHCYAEALDKRFAGNHWGPHASRRRTRPANWKEPRRWNREAGNSGKRPWVFCASMADIFDNAVPAGWRRDLWQLIRETPHLNWQLLTKRIGNVRAMLPPEWPIGFAHVGLMITVTNQAEADRDVPRLLEIPAAWRGLSCEPLLGPIALDALNQRKLRDWDGVTWTAQSALSGRHLHRVRETDPWMSAGSAGAHLDWVIVGGESGLDARPFNVNWTRLLLDQCQLAGVPIFLKQLGARPVWNGGDQLGSWAQHVAFAGAGGNLEIRLKDRKGADWSEWPEDLRVREMPEVRV